MREVWYPNNRGRHLAAVGLVNRRVQAEAAALIVEAKNRPCTDCGQRFPACAMDFDHVTGRKIANVGDMLTRGLARLRAEIAKCEVVCANCHRIRPFTRQRQRVDSGNVEEAFGKQLSLTSG